MTSKLENSVSRSIDEGMAPLNTYAPGIQQNPNRAAWSGNKHFFLTTIGYTAGLGNIWRFPYFCHQNGGGAFLIAYTIMFILQGIPLFFIELGIGQTMRLGSLGVWNSIHPWFAGIGISSCIITLLVASYYNVIIAWCVYYFVNILQFELPWGNCPTFENRTYPECTTPTTYFWYRQTLDIAPSIDQPESLKLWMVLCLFVSWLVVFFIVMKGIQSSRKVVYFTSLFPYVALTIFFVRAITLEGAAVGVAHMFKPQMYKLLEPTVWLDAATDVFYSFGLAFGSLVAFGSYNTPKKNCIKDVLLVSGCKYFTTIYTSVVMFAIIGNIGTTAVEKCLAYSEYNRNLDWGFNSNCTFEYQLRPVALEGTGFAFISIPKFLIQLPGATMWFILFFTMLMSLGIGSQIGLLEGTLCILFDVEQMKRLPKQCVTAGVCLFCFIVGLIFCTGAGAYWFYLFDSFAGTIGLLVIALMELIVVVCIYGLQRFSEDIFQMTGYRPGFYWRVTLKFFTPLIIALSLLVSILNMIIVGNADYGAWIAERAQTERVPYPTWVFGIAITIITVGVLPIPNVFCFRCFHHIWKKVRR